jgi:3-methyladenine DNA glycosylase AlkD
MSLTLLRLEAKKHATKKRAEANAWYFKTGKGEYGEGDKFLGLTMPAQRKIAKQFCALPYTDIKKLLDDSYHELRMIGLLILVYKFEKTSEKGQKKIFNFYLRNRKAVNKWDLVDVSTPKIVGKYLLERPVAERKFLYTYAKSKNLWVRRIAILATFPFIDANKFNDTLKISKMLLDDKEDLIHKAVGWALREVGKKDEKVLKNFLDTHIRKLPRTTLRYSIERFPEKERKMYLKM